MPVSDAPLQFRQESGASPSADKSATELTVFDLEKVVREYQSPLLRYVGQLIGRRYDEVQDVVQDVFIRLHQKVHSDGLDSIQNLRCWLYRVAHNLAMDYGRRRGRKNRLEEQIMSDPVINAQSETRGPYDAGAMLAHAELCELAMSELRKLPDEQKTVLLLKLIQGLTLREISDITGLKIGTVNYRLTQGLRTLTERLRALNAIPEEG